MTAAVTVLAYMEKDLVSTILAGSTANILNKKPFVKSFGYLPVDELLFEFLLRSLTALQ